MGGERERINFAIFGSLDYFTELQVGNCNLDGTYIYCVLGVDLKGPYHGWGPAQWKILNLEYPDWLKCTSQPISECLRCFSNRTLQVIQAIIFHVPMYLFFDNKN